MSPQLDRDEARRREWEFARIEQVPLAVLRICWGVQGFAEAGWRDEKRELAIERAGLGLEYLAKMVLVLGHLEQRNELPSTGRLRNIGHDLVELVDSVVRLADEAGYADSRPAVREDVEFLRDDELFRLLLAAMSYLNGGGRYRFLDVLTGGDWEHPHFAWFDPIDRHLRQVHPNIGHEEAHDGGLEELTSRRSRLVIESIQRGARALCRMFTLGLLGDNGQQLSGMVAPFLYLRDDELDLPSRRCL